MNTIHYFPENEKPVVLGCLAEDIITGIRGLVTCKLEYLTGCDRFALQPHKKEGEDKIPETIYLDALQLRRIGDGLLSSSFVDGPTVALKKGVIYEEPGGHKDDPPSRHTL